MVVGENGSSPVNILVGEKTMFLLDPRLVGEVPMVQMSNAGERVRKPMGVGRVPEAASPTLLPRKPARIIEPGMVLPSRNMD